MDMEQAKRRKLNECQIDFSNIDDIVVHDPLDSDSENDETLIESEVDEPTALLGVVSEESQGVNDEIHIAVNLPEDEKLKNLLMQWGVPSFLDNLLSCGINYKNLELLEEADYKILLINDHSKLGEMITFRKFHRNWKSYAMDRQSEREEYISDVNDVNNVKYILKNGGDIAKEIINYYETNLNLIDSLRVQLVNLILKKKRQISRKILNNIADQICTIFPGELKRVYYHKLKNQLPTGILYQKYKESREKKNIHQSTTTELHAEDLDTLLTDEVQSSIEFLNNEENYDGNSDASLIVHHWKSTFTFRNSMKYINATEAINDWLPLQKVDGNLMIHLDFANKYGTESAGSLTSKWEDFIFRNQHVILEGIRDGKVKKSLLAAQSGNDVNIKNRIFMMALHHLSYTVPTKVSIKNGTWTPTIPESKDSFLMVVKNSAEVDKHLKSYNKIRELKNIKQHPIIFELNNPKDISYIIALGNTTYECSSLIDAVDDAFKIFVMLKIPFPPQCSRVWLFLNELFYKNDLEQKPHAKLISILNSYKL